MMSPARPHRHAFTLLELLTVVGIIAILISLLVAGGLKMIGSSKSSSTRITLGVLQNMLAEFDAKTRLGPSPAYWLWSENGTTLTYEVNAATSGLDLNFWKVPYKAVGPPVRYESLYAPQVVSVEGGGERNASVAAYNTALVMPLLLSLPSNRAAIEKMSPDRFFTPTWLSTSPTDPNLKVQVPGPDLALMTGDEGAAQNPAYYQGAIVQYNGKRYRAIADPGSAVPTDTTKWLELPNAAPVLLDAWNNPIIFVPASGLRVRLLNGEKDYMKGGMPYNSANLGITIVISPEGQVDMTTPSTPFCKKPGRPFFASAGPDGNFATGDDNLYSFEQQ